MGSILLVCGTVCPIAQAAAPEFVREWTNSFDGLIWDGSVLWLCDHADSISHELIGLTGVTADGQEVSRTIPERAFRAGAATNGTLYATVWGTETGSNPSVWLWRYQDEGGWQSVARIRGPDSMVAVDDATIIPFGNLVLIDLDVSWFIWGSGVIIVNGPPTEPDLAVFDTDSSVISMPVPRADGIFATTEGAYCYSRQLNFSRTWDLMRSADGSNWVNIPTTLQPLDMYRQSGGLIVIGFAPTIPATTSGAFGFSHGVTVENWAAGFSTTRLIPLAENGYTPEALSAPPDIVYQGGAYKGLAVARGGECAVALMEFPSTNTQAFQLVAMSNDYLQNFEFHQLNDLGHIDALATPEATFLLRKTPSGSRLLKIPLPPEQLPVANARRISLDIGSEEVSVPGMGLMVTQMITVAIMDLGMEGAGEGPVQIQTSTDLKNWYNLGLPMNTNAAFRMFISDKARFFR